MTVRSNRFNRLYVAAMFGVITAIGSFGVFALARDRQSFDRVSRSVEQAQYVTEMGSALNGEYAALHAQTIRNALNTPKHAHGTQARRPRSDPSNRAARAARRFDKALFELGRAGWPTSDPLLRSVATHHAAFAVERRAIVAASSRGDQRLAMRIEAGKLRPNGTSIRDALDTISAAAFRASVQQQARNARFSAELQRLIAFATALGIALMAGFATLLRRYERSAFASATARLAALQQAALTDNLTNLGNNRSFHDDFERELARAKRHGHSLVLALLDVDGFKAVNDAGGHAHGDRVLAAVGERLLNMRQEDRAYRIGGDEFALVLAETDPAGAALALERLQAEIREFGLGATVSIGYANLSGEQLDAESYERADRALYEAKRLGRNQTVAFENICGAVSVFSPRKGDAVRAMIAQGLVRIAFQPIWDMRTARPLGFEALARPHPDLGLAGPQEAFDVAQRTRQLAELDRLCMRKALETAVNLPAGSLIFLNYSPASLTHAGFDPRACVDMVRAAGLRPEQVVIELTERRIDDPSLVADRVAELRSLGVRMALDDTGSGHAGLEILSKVPFDFVKIDRGLVVNAMQNREARGVLAGIVAIARETGSYLIAEGIETTEMLEFIANTHFSQSGTFAGVRGLQGYLLGKPETGPLDLRSLQPYRDVLAARAQDTFSNARTVDVVSSAKRTQVLRRRFPLPASSS
jgi:diguanylate cyclase (GGDEF)-like protein